MNNNRICSLLGIEFPIIQAGMVWCSGWELASAVSNAGGLGMIGAGSMYPEVLRTHLQKCKQATDKPFAVNLPLLYPNIDEHIRSIIEFKVPVVFTSAGNPASHTAFFKERGITVVHVVSSSKFARKAMDAGCDAVVAEGFEAGGHNGREETTTLVLVPQVVEALEGKIPLIAAGGIATGRAMAAMFCLGAEAVQMGTRFAATVESSAHIHYKQRITESVEGDTVLTLKEVTPVRMFKNAFYAELAEAYARGANADELREILGRGRSKKGVFEGDLEQGELEVGQVSSAIKSIETAADVVKNTMEEFRAVLQRSAAWY
ncbi:MAG: nitronate monooxygenase [Bacteroidia bacterium]|nr:nitronate monooxygenase [Bacteroidia bacterium]